jgi:hypothetical protein
MPRPARRFAGRPAAARHRKRSCSEVEPTRRRDHDLAIDDAARRQAREQGVVQFGEVAVEGMAVAALDEQCAAAAEDDRPKAVPLRLVDVRGTIRDRVGHLRQRGRDRRPDRCERQGHRRFTHIARAHVRHSGAASVRV